MFYQFFCFLRRKRNGQFEISYFGFLGSQLVFHLEVFLLEFVFKGVLDLFVELLQLIRAACFCDEFELFVEAVVLDDELFDDAAHFGHLNIKIKVLLFQVGLYTFGVIYFSEQGFFVFEMFVIDLLKLVAFAFQVQDSEQKFSFAFL